MNRWWLVQGNDIRIKGIDIVDFIYRSKVLNNKAITHASFVCKYRFLKQEVYHIRITVGGNRLPYKEDAGSQAANLFETKLLLNSTIVDANKGERFISSYTKDYFLAILMKDPEYMRVKYQWIFQDTRRKYNLD